MCWVRNPRGILQSFVSVLLGLLMSSGHPVWAAVRRDPFLFGSAERELQPPATPAILTGILWDATNPLALISGEPVTAGAAVGNWRIVEIRPDGLVIQRQDRTRILKPGDAFPSE